MKKLSQILTDYKISERNTDIQIEEIKNGFRVDYEFSGEILNIEKVGLGSHSTIYGRIALKTNELENTFIYFTKKDLIDKQLTKFYRGDNVLIIGRLIEIYGSFSCTFHLISIKLLE